MIPGLDQFTNSGSMPISGDARSGNGDSVFDAGAHFGGLNYSRGIPPWVPLAAGVAILAWMALK